MHPRSYALVVGHQTVDVPTPVLGQLSTLCQIRAGRRVITAGQVGRECFVLVSGVLSVHAANTGEYLKTLAPGELVGELAVRRRRPRQADVVANTDALVLVLTPQEFETLYASIDEFASAVDEKLASLTEE